MILISFFFLFAFGFDSLIFVLCSNVVTFFSDTSLGEGALAWAAIDEMIYDMAFIRYGYKDPLSIYLSVHQINNGFCFNIRYGI